MSQFETTLGPRFEAAVGDALRLHASQRRKGTQIPYVGHLLGVAGLVIDDGGDEDEAIAAVLHDAVEDQGGQESLERIRERFGDRVADTVQGCSDTDQVPKPPWRQRKEGYIAHLAGAPTSVVRVSLADKLNNLRAIARDLRTHGDAVWGRFNAGQNEQLWYYGQLLTIFQRISPSPMVGELAITLDEVRDLASATPGEVTAPASVPRRRVVAVDWSGDQDDKGRSLYVAEVVDGELRRLTNRLRRGQVTELLIELRADDPRLAVGLDFAFSLPSWFLAEQAFASAPDLWAAGPIIDGWLSDCPRPFWGRSGRPRHMDLPEHYRLTELETQATGGIRPKSVFQIGGAGAVGTGSLRGFPELSRLRAAGFSIWPFDPPGPSLVVEIYPRILTGAITKSSSIQRHGYLESRQWPRDLNLQAIASASEDAFDAAMSAYRMWEYAAELDRLPTITNAQIRREGWIWAPGRPLPG